MKRTKLIAGAFAALTLAGAAQAQAPAALEGKIVRGQDGVVLGVVERVTYRDNGAREGLAFYRDGHVALYDEMLSALSRRTEPLAVTSIRIASPDFDLAAVRRVMPKLEPARAGLTKTGYSRPAASTRASAASGSRAQSRSVTTT